MLVHLAHIRDHVDLWRCTKTGIATVSDTSAGISYSCHPNISATGSVAGMKRFGYWNKNDRCIRSNGFIYNVNHRIAYSDLDQLALDNCNCVACREGE